MVPCTEEKPKLMVKLKVLQEKEYKSSPMSRPTPERKRQTEKEKNKLRKAKLVVKDHNKAEATKQWGPLITDIQERRKRKQEGKHGC
jgi:hypothetical protein